MKIEKINDNQIRCDLTSEDLSMHHLKMSELAYGTEKTRGLFQELLRQADYTCGFEAANVPLMIEAIPMGTDSIRLIVTKINDPDELDTRFSRFSPRTGESFDEDDDEDWDDYSEEFEEQMMNASRYGGQHDLPTPSFHEILDRVSSEAENRLIAFTLDSIGSAMDLASVIASFKGDSSLYRDHSTGKYILALRQGKEDHAVFRNVCQTCMEFGKGSVLPAAGEQALHEHGELLIAEHAVAKLSCRND